MTSKTDNERLATRSQERQLHQKLQRLLGEAIREFDLIHENDRILLGLSGGKDSLALLDLLGERMKHSNRNFSIEAIHVKMRNIHYESDLGYLIQKAEGLGIPLHIIEVEFEPDRNVKRTPCYLCSWNRRKILFSEAQRLDCNKIALGHHKDDIIKTALMNLTFNGRLSTMPIRIEMRKFPITIVRPLAKIPETELQEWAKAKDYLPVVKECPFDKLSNRTNIDRLTRQMAALCPEYKNNIWHALLTSGALTETR